MVIRLLSRGTLFDVVVLGDTPDSNITLKGTLYDTERDIKLFFEGAELYKYFETQTPGLRVNLLFYNESMEYFLSGKFVWTLTKYGVDLVEIEATSGIGERTRRTTLRLELSLPVNMYVQTDGGAKVLVCSGTSVDISTKSVCFLSKGKLDVQKDSRFFVAFTLCGSELFNLPAKLVKYGDSPQSVQYKHDYTLVYDFSGIEEEKSRLLTSLFKHNLEARQ